MAPSYDFECQSCGFTENIWCHHSMINAFTCPKCQEKLKVVPSAASFVINGYKAKNNYE